MAGGEAGLPWLGGDVGEELEERLREGYEAAQRAAAELGLPVGRVTRYWKVETGPGATVKIEVDPEQYFTSRWGPLHRAGDYLVAVDPKSLRAVLLRVRRIMRADTLALIGLEPPLSRYQEALDPLSVATLTIIEAEPLVEAPASLDEPPVPAVTSLEPMSPVVVPRREVLERLLGLPGEGALLGALAGPWGAIGGGIPVRLPYRAFLQHVLIVGTTGSGKTTLIKNMIASIYSDTSTSRKPLVVVIDHNQDYIQLPFPGERPREEWAASVYESVHPPRGLVVVVPLSVGLLQTAGVGACGGFEDFYEHYVDAYLRPLDPGAALERTVEGGLPRGLVRAGGREIVLVPYAISTLESRTDELLGLMPGLTLLARDLLRRLREKARRIIGGVYPPLYAIAGALLASITVRGRQQGEHRGGRDEELEAALEVAESYIASPSGRPVAGADLIYKGQELGLGDLVSAVLEAMERILPHRGTVEALYRRLTGLLESGLVDVTVECAGKLVPLGEPPWEEIIALAGGMGAPVVVDLKPAGESGLGGVEAPRVVAYRMLRRLIGWKQEAYAKRQETPPLVAVLDEAHQFFPQEKGPQEEAEASRQVAGMISKIARLGRARGLGLVFATHSPRDLHDIILQLANTKIVLRTERGQLERIEVPRDVGELAPRFPDRMFAVMSHAFREGYVLAVTPPPVVKHYDVSAPSV